MDENQEFQSSQESTTSGWLWISVFLFLVLIVGAAAIYKYAHFDGVDSQTLRANYIKKNYITFSDLTYSEQQKYVLAATVKPEEEIIKEYKKSLEVAEPKVEEEPIQEEKSDMSQSMNESSQTTVEQKVAVSIPQSSSDKPELPVKDTSSKTMLEQRMQCEDFEVGSYRLTKECKSRVKEFISKIEEGTTVEVIPLVDKSDFAILEALADMGNSAYMKSQQGADMLCTMVNSMGLNINDCAANWLDSLHLSKSELDRLSFIANTGLGKLRSNEAGWYISTLTKSEIQPVNYHITTNHKRGFILRLYR